MRDRRTTGRGERERAEEKENAKLWRMVELENGVYAWASAFSVFLKNIYFVDVSGSAYTHTQRERKNESVYFRKRKIPRNSRKAKINSLQPIRLFHENLNISHWLCSIRGDSYCLRFSQAHRIATHRHHRRRRRRRRFFLFRLCSLILFATRSVFFCICRGEFMSSSLFSSSSSSLLPLSSHHWIWSLTFIFGLHLHWMPFA